MGKIRFKIISMLLSAREKWLLKDALQKMAEDKLSSMGETLHEDGRIMYRISMELKSNYKYKY